MSKPKTSFLCSSCSGITSKWAGKCPHCGEWNQLVETSLVDEGSASRYAGWAGSAKGVVKLSQVKDNPFARIDTGISEFNRVLGGGLVEGSVVLLGGDPGVGKSTLLLQVLAAIGTQKEVLYSTGEESDVQVALRAQRMGLKEANISLLAEVHLEKVLDTISSSKAKVVVVDSIQTMFTSHLQAAPGTVSQVRECAAHLTRMAKREGVVVFLVGHVTKEGSLAGPRILEHMVDCTLYFEGEQGSPYRMIRAFKNRYGSANELGVFRMEETGLAQVSNPSSMFLTSHERPVSGSCILTAMEGNRPFLVEVQALVEDTVTPNAKRAASGIDSNRLQMLLAVLHKHAHVMAFDQNVYVKVVGGVRLTEPAADLAVLLSVHSSLRNTPLPKGLVVFGEVGLAGEVRPVQDAETRLKEAVKLGFTTAIVPAHCQIKCPLEGIEILRVSRVEQALRAITDIRAAA